MITESFVSNALWLVGGTVITMLIVTKGNGVVLLSGIITLLIIAGIGLHVCGKTAKNT